MCIRDSHGGEEWRLERELGREREFSALSDGPDGDAAVGVCLLYTSDAADDLLCVDLGGRRIIKKKKHQTTLTSRSYNVTHTHETTKLDHTPIYAYRVTQLPT